MNGTYSSSLTLLNFGMWINAQAKFKETCKSRVCYMYSSLNGTCIFKSFFFNLWNTCIAIFFLDEWNKNFKYRVFENENRNKH